MGFCCCSHSIARSSCLYNRHPGITKYKTISSYIISVQNSTNVSQPIIEENTKKLRHTAKKCEFPCKKKKKTPVLCSTPYRNFLVQRFIIIFVLVAPQHHYNAVILFYRSEKTYSLNILSAVAQLNMIMTVTL